MDKARLTQMLGVTTCLISKGERTRKKLPGIPSLLWGLMASPNDQCVEKLLKVDCQFVIVGINVACAWRHRSEFLGFLDSYPDLEQLSEGPTYKHVSRVVGDDMTALRVFGLGAALGVWDVLLPTHLGIPASLADEAAELGLIVTTGYNPQQMPMAAVG